MIDTVIISGGNIQKDFALDFLNRLISRAGRESLFLVGADRGLEFFMEAGIRPDAAVGDFDSLSPAGREYLKERKDVEVLLLKPEKDDSDTQSAVNYAAARGAKEILLLGATGTRLDHVLANLELLVLGAERGVNISMADANNYITLARNGMVLKKEEQWGKYVSFFPLGGDVKGLTLEGFYYPLRDHLLRVSDCGLTVSNEIQEETARVRFSGGNLLMLMTRD